MHDDPRINRLIEEILAGSGLSIDRRREIAEELRGHLEQSVARRCAGGQSDEQSIQAVLAEFGSPAVIRRQLQRQQRIAEHRRALADFRRQIWLPLTFCGLFAILSLRLGASGSFLMNCLAGIAVFAGLFVFMAAFMYTATRLSYWVQRRRPRHEYHFLRSCLHWMAVVALGFAALVPMLFLELTACSVFLDSSPRLLCSNFTVAWFEAPARNFGLTALGILAFGLPIALYERSRCTDDPTPRLSP